MACNLPSSRLGAVTVTRLRSWDWLDTTLTEGSRPLAWAANEPCSDATAFAAAVRSVGGADSDGDWLRITDTATSAFGLPAGTPGIVAVTPVSDPPAVAASAAVGAWGAISQKVSRTVAMPTVRR